MLDKNLLNNLLSPYFEQLEKILNLRRAFNLELADVEKPFNLTFKQLYFVFKNVYKVERRVLKGYLKRLYSQMTEDIPDVKNAVKLPATVEYEVQSELKPDCTAIAVTEQNSTAVAVQTPSDTPQTVVNAEDGKDLADQSADAAEVEQECFADFEGQFQTLQTDSQADCETAVNVVCETLKTA